MNTVKFDNFNITYFINDNMAESSIGIKKYWEPHITNFTILLKQKYDIKNIIDVGANFGYHSLFFSQIIGTDGKIYSFEPQPQNFELLSKNVSNNNIQNIEIFNNACSDKEQIVSLPIFEIPLNGKHNMGDITCDYIGEAKSSNIQAIRIDSLSLPKIDLIKIDVQGWETKVIDGLEKIIQKDYPIMIVEFEYNQLMKINKNCQDLVNLLNKYDYYIYYLEYEYPSDHICVHKSMLTDFQNKFKDHIFNHTEFNNINFNTQIGINKKIRIK